MRDLARVRSPGRPLSRRARQGAWTNGVALELLGELGRQRVVFEVTEIIRGRRPWPPTGTAPRGRRAPPAPGAPASPPATAFRAGWPASPAPRTRRQGSWGLLSQSRRSSRPPRRDRRFPLG